MDNATNSTRTWHLPPTALIPNSPFPLNYYPGMLLTTFAQSTLSSDPSSPQPHTPANELALCAYELFHRNIWTPQWIYRYGPTQQAHYHSRVHECMAVLCGEASITFGAADSEIAADDGSDQARYEHGITIQAKAGDVFVIPAGVAHKTHRVTAESSFALLTPGDGHGIPSRNDPGRNATETEIRDLLAEVELTGFAMFGAYPTSSSEAWDYAVGGEDVGGFEEVWNVPIPEKDPVYGDRGEGLIGSWTCEITR